MPENRVWLITGSSSGFGRALAEAALERGDSVVATARRPEQLADLAASERVYPVALDVTDAHQRQAAVRTAADRFGRIDVLVNNAGRTQVGAVEETTDDELRSLFELHFFAPAALTRAVLPIMRAQRGGVIVQMSSVGGQVPAPGFGAYCATKFALEGLTETLRDEVTPFGIRTLIVEPGAFRTGLFRPDAAYASAEMPEYAQTVGSTRQFIRSNDGLQPGDPVRPRRPFSQRSMLTSLRCALCSATTRSAACAHASTGCPRSLQPGKTWAAGPRSPSPDRLWRSPRRRQMPRPAPVVTTVLPALQVVGAGFARHSEVAGRVHPSVLPPAQNIHSRVPMSATHLTRLITHIGGSGSHPTAARRVS